MNRTTIAVDSRQAHNWITTGFKRSVCLFKKHRFEVSDYYVFTRCARVACARCHETHFLSNVENEIEAKNYSSRAVDPMLTILPWALVGLMIAGIGMIVV